MGRYDQQNYIPTKQDYDYDVMNGFVPHNLSFDDYKDFCTKSYVEQEIAWKRAESAQIRAGKIILFIFWLIIVPCAAITVVFTTAMVYFYH